MVRNMKMKLSKNKKAVSPVVSVVLLIGIAVAASALVYSWYAGMQKGTQEATGETAARTAQASSAGILITNIEYNTTLDTMNVTVSNIGSIAVHDLKLYVDNSPLSLDQSVSELAIDSTTVLNTSNFGYSSGVHTVKVTTKEGAQASQTLVL